MVHEGGSLSEFLGDSYIGKNRQNFGTSPWSAGAMLESLSGQPCWPPKNMDEHGSSLEFQHI
jgi:hypothetical protein